MEPIDLGEEPIPEIVLTFKGEESRIPMDGHKVYDFWPLARRVMHWEKLSTPELLDEFKRIAEDLQKFLDTKGEEGRADQPMDEPAMCKAVDTLLPEQFKGQLRPRYYKAVFDEAVRICLSEIFFTGEPTSGEAQSSAE